MPDSKPSDVANSAPSERTWFIGPSKANYFKFVFAGFVFYLVRTSCIAKYVIRIPGATRAGLWAFRVRVLSRDFDELEIEGLPPHLKSSTNASDPDDNNSI